MSCNPTWPTTTDQDNPNIPAWLAACHGKDKNRQDQKGRGETPVAESLEDKQLDVGEIERDQGADEGERDKSRGCQLRPGFPA